MKNNIYKKTNAFTIIELIVIMAVLAILVFLGSLGYKGYTKQAKLTKLQYDTRVLSDACQRFYVDNGDYPRLTDTPYTAGQVNAFSTKVYDQKGAVVSVDSSGSYYDIDFTKLKRYVSVNENYLNFVLQNPVGDIYFLEPTKNSRLPENAALIPAAPTVAVDAKNNPPTYTVTYPSGVTPDLTEYQLDGKDIVNTAPVSVLLEGTHNIKVRYERNGFYSPWASADFEISSKGALQISTGDRYAIALMKDGTVKAWGYNDAGQLGIATNFGTSTPVTVPTVIPGLTGVKQVSAGYNHTLVLMNDGTVKAFGYNCYGELGDAAHNGTGTGIYIPTTISGLSNVKQVSAGSNYSLALLNDGTVKSFGYNWYGTLGTGTNFATTWANPTPTTINELNGVKSISAGYVHVAALMEDGTAKEWGWNYYGQLGTTDGVGQSRGTSTPTTVAGLSNVKQICAGGSYTLALLNDGTVKSWGCNMYGSLGFANNMNTANPNSTPTLIPGLTGVKSLSNGTYHALAIMNDNSVKTWGSNAFGQLGRPYNSGTANPDPNPTTAIADVAQGCASDNFTVLIMQDGSMKTCGYNRFGQLGTTVNVGTQTPNPNFITIEQ